MDDKSTRVALLDDLESRQDDLLRQIDDLNRRIEEVLADWLHQRQEEKSAA